MIGAIGVLVVRGSMCRVLVRRGVGNGTVGYALSLVESEISRVECEGVILGVCALACGVEGICGDGGVYRGSVRAACV